MSFLLSRPETADSTRETADSTRLSVPDAMAARLRSLLPPGWFSTSSAPLRDALFSGIGSVFAWLLALNTYTRAQTRLSTATGPWLDLAALDFFGLRFQRRGNEADPAFSARIRAEIIRPRATRDALSRVVTDLTGTAPGILELFNPGDCGAYGVGTLAYGGTSAFKPTLGGYGGFLGGYGVASVTWGAPIGRGPTAGGAGVYGSLQYPNQIFLTIHRPAALYPNLANCGGYGIGPLFYGGGRDGAPAFAGYDGSTGGYGAGAASWGSPPPPYTHFTGLGFYADPSDAMAITDDEINAAVAATAAGGVIALTRITGP